MISLPAGKLQRQEGKEFMKIEVLPVALIPSTLSDKIKKSETMLERVFSKLFPSREIEIEEKSHGGTT